MDTEVIEYLNARTRASEAARVRTYRVYIGQREVTVKLHDNGPAAGPDRYSALAYLSDTPEEDQHTADDRFSFGNPASTILEALSHIHWWKIEAAALNDD